MVCGLAFAQLLMGQSTPYFNESAQLYQLNCYFQKKFGTPVVHDALSMHPIWPDVAKSAWHRSLGKFTTREIACKN